MINKNVTIISSIQSRKNADSKMADKNLDNDIWSNVANMKKTGKERSLPRNQVLNCFRGKHLLRYHFFVITASMLWAGGWVVAELFLSLF